MARTAGRGANETKRLILDAAARVVGAQGTSVPVTDIAEAAGVSKGGLLYHFPTKEALLAGLAEDLMVQFRTKVESTAEQEGGNAPGKLTRAYIQVSFAYAEDVAGLREHAALAVHLMFEPGMEELAQQDARKWRTDLLNDGLDQSIIRMVIATADGINSAPLWGAVLNENDLAGLEADLIELTHRNQALDHACNS